MINSNGSNIKTYVSEEDGLLHFTDWTGADSVLPFNKGSNISKINMRLRGCGGPSSSNYISYDVTNLVITISEDGTVSLSGSKSGQREAKAYYWYSLSITSYS